VTSIASRRIRPGLDDGDGDEGGDGEAGESEAAVVGDGDGGGEDDGGEGDGEGENGGGEEGRVVEDADGVADAVGFFGFVDGGADECDGAG
jgi:hypothetical protein